MLPIAENSSPAESFAAARAALEALPSSHRVTAGEAEAIYAMVHSAIVQGQHDTALRYLALLTFLQPTEPRYLGALALTYKQVGLTTEALKVYCYLALLEPAELLHPLAVAECHLLLQQAQQEAEAVRRQAGEQGVGHTPRAPGAASAPPGAAFASAGAAALYRREYGGVGLHPRRDVVGEAEVGEVEQPRVRAAAVVAAAQRGQLPVENGQDARLGRVEHEVVQPEVPMEKDGGGTAGGAARAAFAPAPTPRGGGRDGGAQPGREARHVGRGGVGGGRVLRRPARHLAGQEAWGREGAGAAQDAESVAVVEVGGISVLCRTTQGGRGASHTAKGHAFTL